MNFRERAAIAAMSVIIDNAIGVGQGDENGWPGWDKVAALAWEYADALAAEQERRENERWEATRAQLQAQLEPTTPAAFDTNHERAELIAAVENAEDRESERDARADLARHDAAATPAASGPATTGFVARGNGEDAITLTLRDFDARDLFNDLLLAAGFLSPASRRVMGMLNAALNG